jgi:general secretion pathway protein L
LNAWTHSLLKAPQWRAARWAAVALVAVNLVGLQAWAWREKSDQTAKRAAIQSVLVTTFPEVRVVVDAPLQMARALADLQRQSGTAASADLETLLMQYQAAAPGAPAPAAIEFIAGELQVKTVDGSTQVVQAIQTVPAERRP